MLKYSSSSTDDIEQGYLVTSSLGGYVEIHWNHQDRSWLRKQDRLPLIYLVAAFTLLIISGVFAYVWKSSPESSDFLPTLTLLPLAFATALLYMSLKHKAHKIDAWLNRRCNRS